MMRRPMAISIFNDEGLKNKLWLLTHVASVSPPPPILNRFFNNKPLFYLSDFTKRWLQHFNLDYLFINGDPYDRFQTPRAGLISLFALPFFIWGLKIIMQRIIQKRSNRSIIGKSNKEGIFILGWLGISPIVSSLAVFTPNSLHTFDAVVPFQIITAAGLTVFLLKIKNSLRRGLILAFAILVFLLPFFYSYTQTVPHHSQYASFWHYGFEELMEEVKNSERDYHKIFFLGNANFDLVAFFQKYPPVKFQEEVVYKSASDKKFYDRIESFGKYYFLEKAEELKNIPSNSLIILGGEYGQKIKLIKNNTVAVVLWAPPNQEVSFKVRKIFYYRDGRISYILTQS